MANPIFHSQYTAAQIEDLIENGAPIIQNGYWWRWDVATQQYVNTNITADSETAAQAAEAAQAAAEDARDDAQDAQTAAETAQGLAEDARDAAAASAASIAASAAQIDANTARIDYVALREEEDRQILFGSIVEAAEDEYPELRSAPIHNAITIGGSVYPRMDRTRMAIDAIKGRTVAFNQLCSYGTSAISGGGVTFTPDGNGSWDFAGTPTQTRSIIGTISLRKDHVYLVREQSVANTWALSYAQFYRMSAGYDAWRVVKSAMDNPEYFGLQFASTGTAVSGKVTPQCIDLTAMYGTTLADSIYAMEQATTGAGVAYVRQRMDLDYYASNAGELKAPVVSGVSFTGANVFDISVADWKHNKRISTTDGSIVDNNSFMYGAYYYPALPAGRYTMRYIKGTGGNLGVSLALYDSAKVWQQNLIIASSTSQTGEIVSTFDFPVGFAYFRVGTIENDYNPTLTISGGNSPTTEPYKEPRSLSLPSTRLDGVGTAQDVLFVREDGENDYSLILSNKADEDAFSALNWSYEADTQRFYAPISNLIKSDIDGAAQTRGLMCDADYEIIFSNGMANYTAMTNVISTLDKIIWQYTNNSGVPNLNVKDTRYTTVEAFVAAMGAKKIAYEVATPTETVIAEHLTLADISAIAENGGIVSIVNENGHIVQPDVVMDTVISRSAS